MSDETTDPLVRHLLPPAGYADIDAAEWRDRLTADRRQGVDWLSWFFDGQYGGNVVAEAVAEMADRLDAVTAERDEWKRAAEQWQQMAEEWKRTAETGLATAKDAVGRLCYPFGRGKA